MVSKFPCLIVIDVIGNINFISIILCQISINYEGGFILAALVSTNLTPLLFGFVISVEF
jgi:hypothetical protein